MLLPLQVQDAQLSLPALLATWHGRVAVAAELVGTAAMLPFLYAEACSAMAYKADFLDLWRLLDLSTYALQARAGDTWQCYCGPVASPFVCIARSCCQTKRCPDAGRHRGTAPGPHALWAPHPAGGGGRAVRAAAVQAAGQSQCECGGSCRGPGVRLVLLLPRLSGWCRRAAFQHSPCLPPSLCLRSQFYSRVFPATRFAFVDDLKEVLRDVSAVSARWCLHVPPR